MGLWFSSTSWNPHAAKVVAADGTLREYSNFVTVSDVLGTNCTSSFVCNSDNLTYNTQIPVLHLNTPLRPGQLYFVLPVEILGTPLSGSDMAALATKAISALNSVSGKCSFRRRSKLPVVLFGAAVDEVEEENQERVRVFIRPRSAQKQERRSRALRVRASGLSSRVQLRTIEEVAE